ncbi:MAG: hypothetical protein KGL46_03410 [Hyphomicrobiales bacterium]|nr:hypothetical protein [Hyphomicrobiales bacterium]
MTSRRAFIAALAAAPFAAHGCGFDGAFDGSLGFVHPRGIEVALAVRKAVEDGALPAEALAPVRPGPAGLWRASEYLRHFARRLPARPDAPEFHLLLSEVALWTHYAHDAQGYAARIHAAAPAADGLTLVTDLSVVAALNESRIGAQDALARGLAIVEGAGAERLRALMQAPPASARATLADRSAFGAH